MKQENADLSICPKCQGEVLFLEKNPDDLFCAKDLGYLVLTILGISIFTVTHWLIFIIVTFIVIAIYYFSSKDVYCPKCSLKVNESGQFFLIVAFFIILLYILNMIIMAFFAFYYGGDAYNGSIVDGHYYFGHGAKNAETEVPWYIYHLSLFGVKLHFLLAFSLLISIIKIKTSK